MTNRPLIVEWEAQLKGLPVVKVLVCTLTDLQWLVEKLRKVEVKPECQQ